MQCRKMVGGTVSYPCEVDTPQGPDHDGPCFSKDNRASENARNKWLREKANRESGLGQFQGVAETTAERYTENATPVPEVASERAERLQRERQALADQARVRERLEASEGFVATPRTYDEPGDAVAQTIYRRVKDDEDDLGLRFREGDQKLPEPNNHPHIHDEVMSDINARKVLGTERYGTPLQPFNGRVALRDVYEEILDAAVYVRQEIEERAKMYDVVLQAQHAFHHGDTVKFANAISELLSYFSVNGEQ